VPSFKPSRGPKLLTLPVAPTCLGPALFIIYS